MQAVLTLSCPDKPGIVSQVTGFLASHQLNMSVTHSAGGAPRRTPDCFLDLSDSFLHSLESAQYGDVSTETFFMRIQFASTANSDLTELEAVRKSFAPVGDTFGGEWTLNGANEKLRVVLLVSKIGHCLNDLLFRQRAGSLPIEIPLIVSNHDEFQSLAATYNIPFVHLQWTKDTKGAAEAKLLELIKEHDIKLVVLARFMQIVSADFCARSCPIINIHHSFLPSFIGAKPYHQAFDRGVKAIGATAHFATADLDEGPVIEQDVTRVTHNMDPKQLTQVGATIEATVLARAVRWFAERRVLLNGRKTVVFS